MAKVNTRYTNATPVMSWCSYKFKPRTDRSRDGKCPVILQAFISGKKIVLEIGLLVPPELWDPEKQEVKGRTEAVHDANMVLAEAKATINKILIEFRLQGKTLTAEAFKDAFLNRATRDDFLAFMLTEIEQRHRSGVITPGTYRHHRVVYQRLAAMYPSIPFSNITAALLEDYHRQLHRYFSEIDRRNGVPAGYHTNTIHSHFKVIKTYLKLAEQRGVRFEWPFHQFRVTRGTSRIVYLTGTELETMLQAWRTEVFRGTEHYALTVFLFSCFTSLRISDILQLSPRDVVQDTIVIRPKKTQRTGAMVRIPLNTVSRAILNIRGEAMFRQISEQKINKHLKTVAAVLGISKNISMHVGRHTFATEFLRRGGQVHVLQKIMGHRDVKTTMVYTHLEDRHLSDQMKLMDV